MSTICISHAVHLLSRLWLNRLGNLLLKNGHSITAQQYYTLYSVRKYGPIGVMELSRLLYVNHTTISRGIATLSKLKMVKRRIDSVDKRTSLVNISEDGVMALEAAEPLVDKFEKENCEIWGSVSSSPKILVDDINAVLRIII